MPEPSTEADALPNHVAEVKGDDAIRILRWSNRVGAFDYPVGTKLYATPTQQARWRMVPLKPSHGMVEAAWATGTEAGGIQDIEDAWTAMLAAAPQPSPTAQAAESVPAPPPPPECETEAEKRAFAFGWFKAQEADRAGRAPAESVLEDAARWQWLADYLIGERTDLDEGIVACTTVDALRQFADAARKQGEKQ